jgi:hypothetical protein
MILFYLRGMSMRYIFFNLAFICLLLSGCVGAGLKATKSFSDDTKDVLTSIRNTATEARDVYRSSLVFPYTRDTTGVISNAEISEDSNFINFVCENPYSELNDSVKTLNAFRDSVNKIATTEPDTLGATLEALAKNADYFSPKKHKEDNLSKPTCEKSLKESLAWSYSFDHPSIEALPSPITTLMEFADKITVILKIVEKAEREAVVRKLAREANTDPDFKKALDKLPSHITNAANDVETYLLRMSYMQFKASQKTDTPNETRLHYLQEALKSINLYEKSKSKDYKKIGNALVDTYKKYFAYMTYSGNDSVSLLDDFLTALNVLKSTDSALSELRSVGKDKQTKSTGGSGLDK